MGLRMVVVVMMFEIVIQWRFLEGLTNLEMTDLVMMVLVSMFEIMIWWRFYRVNKCNAHPLVRRLFVDLISFLFCFFLLHNHALSHNFPCHDQLEFHDEEVVLMMMVMLVYLQLVVMVDTEGGLLLLWQEVILVLFEVMVMVMTRLRLM